MPAIVSHHLFGLDVYAKLAGLIGAGTDERDAFLLGNQGPDPLFNLKALPPAVPYRRLGTIMHSQRPTELLANLHRQFIACAGEAHEQVLRAYAFGFLCHYLFDSTAHPLVFGQQYAYADAGVPGLDREHGCRETHALIETELDEYLLTIKRGVTVDALVPHRETLRCSDKVLGALSRRYPAFIRSTYGLAMTNSAFATGVRLYRASQRILDAGRDGLRSHIDYTRLTGRHHLRIDALTHTARLLPDTVFANHDHLPFPHPFHQGETVAASFDELYRAAYERALEALPCFAAGTFTEQGCAALTQGLNFRGERVAD